MRHLNAIATPKSAPDAGLGACTKEFRSRTGSRRILGPEQYDALANTPGMPEGGKGHALYEVYRAEGVSRDDKARAAARSKAYYDAVRRSAGGN